MERKSRFWERAISYILVLSILLCAVLFIFVSTLVENTNAITTGTGAAQSQIATSFGLPVGNPWEYDFDGFRGGYEYNEWSHDSGSRHPGIDINLLVGASDADHGEPVYAIAHGDVIYAQNTNKAYGKLVIIRHTLPDRSEICSVYAHLDDITVETGTVNKNDQVGTIGSSGTGASHLHWEIRTDCGNEATYPTSGMSEAQVDAKYVNPVEFVSDFNFYSAVTDKVVLFNNTFLRGGEYEYYYPGFTNMDAFESSLRNQVSSLSMPAGWSVNLYDRPGDSAHAEVFTTDVNLSNNNNSDGSGSIDNRTSALQIYTSQQCTPGVTAASVEAASVATSCNPSPSPNPGVNPEPEPPSHPQNPGGRLIIYTEKDYVNPYYELETGAWDIDDREYRSIGIPSGWSFVLEDKNGYQRCFNEDLHNLTDHDEWQFNTDAIYVFSYNICESNASEPPPEPLGDWFLRLWTGTDFDGSSLQVKFTGDERYFWLTNIQFDGFNFNDDFQSLELNDQRSVAVYEHEGLQGGGKCYSDSDSNFGNDTFDNGNPVANGISSFRFFVGDTCSLLPLTPENFWIHEVGEDAIVLVWPPSSPNADGFHVYRIDSSGNATRIASLTVEQAKLNAAEAGLESFNRSWTFNDFTCGQNFTFAVSAYNELGESLHTRQITTDLPACDCNDVHSNGIVLFENALCGGSRVDAIEPIRVSLANFDEQVSSIYVANGWSVEVFENNDSSDGHAVCLNESKWDLSYDTYASDELSLNDSASSIRAFNVPNCGRQLPLGNCENVTYDGVVLFDYLHCLGDERLYAQPGFYNLDDFDNSASSIHIQPSWSVRVWQENTRQGDFACFTESKWDLSFDPYWNWNPNVDPPWDSSRRANNNITSIEVFHDPVCGGVPAPVLADPNEVERVTASTDLTLRWQQNYIPGFWAELAEPNGYVRQSGYLGEPQWHVGHLPPGEYTLYVYSEHLQQQSDSSVISFVVSDALLAQSITFAAIPDKTLGAAPFALSATASSNLPIIFASGTPAVCSVSSSTVTLLTVGTCTITATQPGNGQYDPATIVQRSFNVIQDGDPTHNVFLPSVSSVY